MSAASTNIVAGPTVRPGIMDIAPYVGGESHAPGVQRLIRLASNEGALGPSPMAIEAYRSVATDIHRYPDGHSVALRETLGDVFGLDPNRIICGGGSDELLTLLIRAYAGPGDEVIYSRHGFLMYPIGAQTVGATPIAAPEKNLVTDVDAILGLVTPRTKLVFVTPPNNPTGTYIPAAELKRLHANLPPQVVLVIDAAYAEYVTAADYEPGAALVHDAENVVMTRTFSKMYALGGLRLGWGYFPAAIADVMHRLRNPFNVTSATQAAGAASVRDKEFIARSLAHNTRVRASFTTALEQLGLTVVPSVANFVMARFPETDGKSAAACWDHLKANGILTRKIAAYGFPDALRITIGLDDEMQIVTQTIKDYLTRNS